MTTQEERDVYEQATHAIIKEAAGDNMAAAHYLWNLACISRTIDDIYDESWALIIGIDKYQNVQKLNYAVDDAESMQNILIDILILL